VEGDPNYQFGGIGWIAVGSSGRIYVLDTQAQSVRAYSTDGSYELTFGGPGAGPGEIGRGAIFVVSGPADTLLVPDLVNRRINRYAPDGSALPSVPLEIETGLPMIWRSTSSGVIATQVRPLGLSPALGTSNTINIGDGIPEINMYTPESAWALSDEMDLVYGLNDQYRVSVYGPGGDLSLILTMPFEQRSVGESDRRVVMEYLEKAWLDAGVPPQALPRLRSVVHFGEYFPAYASLQSGPDGSIWVQHVQAVSDLSEEEMENYNLIEDAGGPDWNVFDSDGRYLGSVTMPDRFAPRTFRGDKIYGVSRDESDVQYVMRLRIVRPSLGS
jgi:hypothetical protein